MEHSAGNSVGAEISRKIRSLDIQSLYKSSDSKQEGNNKRTSGVVDNGEARKKKKRKSRKEVPLSSFDPAGTKSRNSLGEVYRDGASSDLPDNLRPGREVDIRGGFSSISRDLDGDGNAVRIPKRRRDFVGRKKIESKQVLRSLGSSPRRIGRSVDHNAKKLKENPVSRRVGGKGSSTNHKAKLSGDSAGKVVFPKVNTRMESDDLKENRTSRASSAQHAKEEDGQLVVKHDNASSKKRYSKHKKRQDMASGSEVIAKKAEPLVDCSTEIRDDSQDEDEENLEQNAARMLSSRFDPSCTGFSSKSRSSVPSSTNGLSFYAPSDQDFASQEADSSAGFKSTSTDNANRVLRPRKQHKEKDLLRKRRHFYEIISSDLDAYWVLNRRIKVFWPLDESWYYGLVKDYDPTRKLHHIKYDDRDEEWIDLQNERFKLLLLASEVPRKIEAERATKGRKHDKNGKRYFSADDGFVGSFLDSEPIISWLARSSRRVKSSAHVVSKRHKSSHLSPNFAPPLLSKKTDDAKSCLDVGSSNRDINNLNSNSPVPDRSIDSRGGKSMVEGTSSSKDGKSAVVYFRRRFHRKDERLFSATKEKIARGSTTDYFPSHASDFHGLHISKVSDISLGDMDSDGLLWSVDNLGLLKLTIPLVKFKEFRFEIGSPFPLPLYILGVEDSWLLHTLLLLQYGTVMTTWPKVHLEMLFVDNIAGLRFLLFEGCLKQAVAFVFLVLTIFYQPSEPGKYIDMGMPATSIRFKLSCIEDLRKHHVFAFYSFSEVKYSKWLILDCKLGRHCLLTKQLPLSECTYDNIKALEGGSDQLHTIASSRELSATEGLRKKSLQDTLPIGPLREYCGIAADQSSSESDLKHAKFLPFALSFAAAPTFFLSLHLKLLMENSVACTNLQERSMMYSLQHSENTGRPTADGFNLIQDCSECVSENSPEDKLGTSKEAKSSGWLPSSKSQLGSDTILECNAGGLVESSHEFLNGNLNVAGTSACSRDPGEKSNGVIVLSEKLECSDQELEQFTTLPKPLVPKHHLSVGISDSRYYSSLTGLSVEIPLLDRVGSSADGKTPGATESTDLAWNMNDGIVRSPNLTGARSIWHRNRNNSSSSPGDYSHLWSNRKADLMHNGFGNGPKKPRTQVQYTLPFGGYDSSSKRKVYNQGGLPYKRIRKASEKRTSDGSRNSNRNLELLACDANLLITIGDRGWRECGVRVVLELADHNEWRLAVKLSGTTKYSYKAHQFLQPGSTNRYTHAMMWRGGKDWVLEFPDRSQWMHFKEMHEECYNRNIRAASVKNIPIPGVRLIEESDDHGAEVPFIRSSPNYFCQLETDVDMAMEPSRILYDMDSDDERWILENQKSSHVHGSRSEDISEELFEKTMDMFEKLAYTQQRDHFTSDEIEEFNVGVGPMEAIKVIHEHWRLKRQKKGMPLVRHLQPPLWERYEQQLKEWEQAMAKGYTAVSSGFQEKTPSMEKPPMFAFCLKPRGLEFPNKGSKQRSHRRFPVSGHSHAILGDQDSPHTFGRRANGFGFGDEKAMFQANSHESSDTSSLFQTSTRAFSPRDASGSAYFSLSSDWSEWNHHPKLNRNKSKKIGTFLPPYYPQMAASYNQRTLGKRNEIPRWNMGLPEWPGQKHYQSEASLRLRIEQLDGSDLDEFRLRDASGAAQHALNMAKLKREKAQRLLYRADLAIHKAVVSLMTAEAKKASSEDLNGNG